MGYYIGNMEFDPDYLEHYGVKGMKWGKHRTRGKIQDWWTGRDHISNINGYQKANTNLRKSADYLIAKTMNDLRGVSNENTRGNIIEKHNQTVSPMFNQIITNKDAAKKEMEKYRKAPRQVIAKTIRDGKTRVAYILNKIKVTDGRKKR